MVSQVFQEVSRVEIGAGREAKMKVMFWPELSEREEGVEWRGVSGGKSSSSSSEEAVEDRNEDDKRGSAEL